MKVFLLIFSTLVISVGCSRNDINQAQTKENISLNITPENLNKNKTQNFSEDSLPVQKSSLTKNPKWIPGSYKGLQPGKSTVKDVKRIFGEPKEIGHPEDKYDNPIQSRLDYIYDNEPQIIIDKKSGTVIEIWGGDFSTFKEAIEKYGNNFYEVEFTAKGCVFNEYKEREKPEYPISIAYPQNGFYFQINASKDVIIYYLAKCE